MMFLTLSHIALSMCVCVLASVRVMQNKGEDILASLSIMFVSLIFIATIMYLVEGNHDTGFNSFESIPLSMYWGVITITTIG